MEAETVALRLASQAGGRQLTLASLPPDHDLFRLVRLVPRLLQRSVQPVESAVAVAHKVFKALYNNDARVFRETHLALLEVIEDVCPKVAKELILWRSTFRHSQRLPSTAT